MEAKADTAAATRHDGLGGPSDSGAHIPDPEMPSHVREQQPVESIPGQHRPASSEPASPAPQAPKAAQHEGPDAMELVRDQDDPRRAFLAAWEQFMASHGLDTSVRRCP